MPVAFKVVYGKRVFRPATEFALQRIRYRLGETTRQGDDHGPFALFESLEGARRFLGWGNGLVVLACEYEESSEEVLWKKGRPVFRSSRFGGGRRCYTTATPRKEFGLRSCPLGTVLASSVTPFLVLNSLDPDDLTFLPPDEPLPWVGGARVHFDGEGKFFQERGA